MNTPNPPLEAVIRNMHRRMHPDENEDTYEALYRIERSFEGTDILAELGLRKPLPRLDVRVLLLDGLDNLSSLRGLLLFLERVQKQLEAGT